MRCICASMGFINENIKHNKNTIIRTIQKYSCVADIIIFGEAFLQGFYGPTFDVEHDKQLAITQDSNIIDEICCVAKEYATAVSFGFIEKENGFFYSSQITVDANGKVIDLFRRVSPGWKELFADNHYREGSGFHTFFFQGKKISIGLCGDLWFDENILEVKHLSPDIVFWPVYTDFNCNDWNERIKYEYAEQAKKFCEKVLYVNSLCKDKDEENIAKGGSALFINGHIIKEIAAGKEDVLLVEI